VVAELVPYAEHLTWLTGPEVIRRDGTVASWVNPAHPGYSYPEIAGYMLSYLAQHGRATVDIRNRVAGRLAADMSVNGAVGRNGVEYVFDSAMALAGLVAHVRSGGLLPAPDMLDRLHEFITTRLERRVATEGGAEAAPDHWSASYGCHQLKCVISLLALADIQPERSSNALIERMLRDLLPLFESGRFRVNAVSQLTYTHAHCYALEALLVLDGRGWHEVRPWIEAGAAWLAALQQEDGGVPSGFGGPVPAVAHADCTAQSVRIWACVDALRYRAAIGRGMSFLSGLSHEGGIRYRAGSDDINTWVTIFGAQALDFAESGGRWEWLI
jgi:hypothetical protein